MGLRDVGYAIRLFSDQIQFLSSHLFISEAVFPVFTVYDQLPLTIYFFWHLIGEIILSIEGLSFLGGILSFIMIG